MTLAADLDAHQEIGQFANRFPIFFVARGTGRLVQGEEAKIACIEHVGDGVAVLRNQRGFVLPVFGIGRNQQVIVVRTGIPQFFPDGAACILALQEFTDNRVQPLAMLRGILHPDKPGQRQDHPGPFLLYAVLNDPVGVTFHHIGDPCAGLVQQRRISATLIQPEI